MYVSIFLFSSMSASTSTSKSPPVSISILFKPAPASWKLVLNLHLHLRLSSCLVSILLSICMFCILQIFHFVTMCDPVSTPMSISMIISMPLPKSARCFMEALRRELAVHGVGGAPVAKSLNWWNYSSNFIIANGLWRMH